MGSTEEDFLFFKNAGDEFLRRIPLFKENIAEYQEQLDQPDLLPSSEAYLRGRVTWSQDAIEQCLETAERCFNKAERELEQMQRELDREKRQVEREEMEMARKGRALERMERDIVRRERAAELNKKEVSLSTDD